MNCKKISEFGFSITEGVIRPRRITPSTIFIILQMIRKPNSIIANYFSFKIFLHFWFTKCTRIIHHNQLLLTKFRRILRIINRWRQKCSTVAGYCTVNREDPRTRLSCFGCEKKNGRTVGGTFYSFHDEIFSKNIARRQLDGHLLFWSIFADLNSTLSSKHALSRWTTWDASILWLLNNLSSKNM